jgi:hypothetical protein
MAGENTGKAVLGGAALVSVAILLAQNKVKAAGGGAVTLDAETLQLLIAMAATSADIEQLLNQIIGQAGQIQVAGYPLNTRTAISVRVRIPALNTSYPLPDIEIPDGFALQIKGWPTNGGIVYIAQSDSAARNINQVWPILPNEAVGYFIKNAKALYVSGTVIGDSCVVTVEQR